MKKRTIFLAICLACASSLWARETMNLNRSWNFIPGYETEKNLYTKINLPHTWNQDALTGKKNYYRGIGIYEKVFEVPAEWKDKKVYLRFKGVNTVADVLINGKHATEHRGGYTTFVIDMTDRIAYGKKNTITVYVNNAKMMDVMPLVGDFNMYGGIYRDVEIIVTDPSHISLTDYASSGVYLEQKNITEKSADIQAKVMVEGVPKSTQKVTVSIQDKEGKEVLKQQSEITLDDKGKGKAQLQMQMKKPHLWNGLTDPYLYKVVTSISSNGIYTDSVIERIGLRTIHIDPEKGFFLNGKHYQIHGVCRHQDHSEIGNALSPINHEEDIEIMREMGVNAIRLAHYPQDKYIYDLCDEKGILVWAEIPFIGPGGYRDKGFNDSESFRENGKEQLKELIRQNYNHPSICMWGLFNELKEAGDNPCNYISELNELAHKEDPTRITTSASNQSGKLNEITDIIAWNQYFGWYGGKPSNIGDWADQVHKAYPSRAIGVSEYGAGASIYQQQEELIQPAANSYWHPENWQTYFHEEHWKAIDKRPFIWGTFVWNMFDFGAAHRTEGEIPGKNDKGLVTFDRNFKKDAFYFYKANWNTTDPFVYIAERRIKNRTSDKVTVKVYSNQPSVELFINGKSCGKKKGEYGTFIWENIHLQKGINQWKAITGKVKDEIKITH